MFSADLLIGLRPFQDRKCTKTAFFLGDIVNKFRSPSILQLNVEGVTARGGYFKTCLETRFRNLGIGLRPLCLNPGRDIAAI